MTLNERCDQNLWLLGKEWRNSPWKNLLSWLDVHLDEAWFR